MSFPNIWHLRRVADTASKACYICYKPSSSVLITPDSKVSINEVNGIARSVCSINSLTISFFQDYFYVCPGHLKDPGFGSPIIDEAEVAARKKKEEMDKEVERVKKEYEEKQKRKKEKDKARAEDKDSKKDDGKGDKEAEKAKAEKVRPWGFSKSID